ncbi:hypothetical protein DERP_009073 [Dermatophagoides pteronyssinus]|uniref:Uncharacterized protein n=1 Tax=Dermatophagoides pteronyssinus TaxID=6956 RepID=A0ABQ8JGW5_DERPT|nr:hypothetical protein DERP_009073 [Dermatophagoides pteronyssinus]
MKPYIVIFHHYSDVNKNFNICNYICNEYLFCGGGSDLPPATQLPFKYFQRCVPICTNSNTIEYIDLGSRPSI